MSLLRTRGRATAIGFGLLLFSAPAARAGECLSDLLCGKHGHTKPSGLTGPSNLANPIYVPMAPQANTLPAVGLSVPLSLSAARDVECNPLATAHEAELHQLRAERAKAALQAEIAYAQRVLGRLGTNPTETGPGVKGTDVADLKDQVQKLNASIQLLDSRLTGVEKLLLIHDNYIAPRAKEGK
jgi:hypothetical protein